MARLKYKINHLLEYAGIKSKDYGHTPSPNSYDPDDPLTYYLDQTPKAAYPGPFDDHGLPLIVYKGKAKVFPVATGLFGLGHFESFRKNGSEDNLLKFRRVADWFIENQDESGNWLTDSQVRKFGICKPWPSAMTQGLAISCLARAFSQFHSEEYLACAIRALEPFYKDVSHGGITSFYGDLVFYDEYPSPSKFHVLNGFIFSLWGLLDLARIANVDKADDLYRNGLNTLSEWLPRFDMDFWSLYCVSKGIRNPASVPYHRLHIEQMDTMYCITGEEIYKEYRSLWQDYLSRRFNALRSLPAKLMWIAVHGF